MKKICFLMMFLLTSAMVLAQQGDKKSMTDTIVGLQEVVVTKKLVKYDGGKYIVDATQLRKGKTDLMDLLSDVPGLMVDGDNISIPGKGGVRVMFNGRMKKIPQSQLVDILKSYRASNVVKVEIIQEPGAKYDAEGNLGLINIITEKKNDYIGGEVSDDVTYAKKWKNTSRMNLNLSSGKISSSLNAGWTYGKNQYEESNIFYYDNITRDGASDYVAKNNDYNIIYNLDYDVAPRSVMGLEVRYSDAVKKLGSTMCSYSYVPNGVLTTTTQSYDNTDNPYANLNVNLYADHKWENGNKIAFAADVFRLKNDKDYMFHSDIFDAGQTDVGYEEVSNTGKSHLKGMSSRLDYDATLPCKIELSTGASMSLSTTDNDSRYGYSTLPNADDFFRYTENIYAAYATLSYNVHKLDFRLGARYEYTHTNGESRTMETSSVRNYGRFFPDVSISYNTDNGSVFSLSSNSGVMRPGLRAVNPFIAYSDPYSAACGNPELKAGHWFNLRTTWFMPFKGGNITHILTYYKEYDGIDQITKMDNATGVAMSQWRNSYNKTSWIYNLLFDFRQLKWMKIYVIGSLSGNKSTPTEEYGKRVGYKLTTDLVGNFRFIFDKSSNFTGYVTARYNGRSENATSVLNAITNINAGLRYSMMKNRLNLSLNFNNIIASNVSGTSYANDGMQMTYDNHFSPFAVVLGCSYSFGKDIRMKRKMRSSDGVIGRF